MQLAMRARLLDLVVAATVNDAVLAATATGYARTNGGSFIDEGFAPGMELVPTGFPGAAARPIVARVTSGTITTAAPPALAAAAAGRSLSVGLPSVRAWEGVPVTTTPGLPYFEEQYVPGASRTTEIGLEARTEARPLYSPRIYVPQVVGGFPTGYLGDGLYADAVLALFYKGLRLTCADGTVLCVMSNPAPTAYQRSLAAVGWSCIPINIPFYTL